VRHPSSADALPQFRATTYRAQALCRHATLFAEHVAIGVLGIAFTLQDPVGGECSVRTKAEGTNDTNDEHCSNNATDERGHEAPLG
jgi:hypothetical protein